MVVMRVTTSLVKLRFERVWPIKLIYWSIGPKGFYVFIIFLFNISY